MLQRCVVDVFMSYACVNHACSTPKLAAIPKMLRLGAFLVLSHIDICKLSRCRGLVLKRMLQLLI